MKRWIEPLLVVVFYTGLALLFFWQPLFQGFGTIQWDTIGVHFWNIAYSFGQLHQGHLPLWTPYIFGGFPQIADLQVALWYPPMLFFALFKTFTPTLLLWEIALHYIVAGAGMYWLARKLGSPAIASLGLGIAYAWGGFMVGHASHIGMMNAAAWFPIIVVLLMDTLSEQSWRKALWCGLVMGIAMLAGHLQVSLFEALMVAFYTIWKVAPLVWARKWRSSLTSLALVALIATVMGGISAIQLAPTLQLSGLSDRATIPLATAQTESLQPTALASLWDWNHNGVSIAPYTGPWDRTQNYLYVGFAVLALAIVGAIWGIANKRTRPLASFFIFTILFSLAYSLGPLTPIQPILYHAPLLGKLRAPGNMMLLAHLSIICLAALACSLTSRRIKKQQVIIGLGVILLALIAIDVVPKTLRSELLFARDDQEKVFANAPVAQQVLKQPGKFRVWRLPGLDNNEPQYYGIDDFGGYNPLQLARHTAYENAMTAAPTLVSLAGIAYGPCNLLGGMPTGAPWAPNSCKTLQAPTPHVFAASQYQHARDGAEALSMLRSVNPLTMAIIETNDSLPYFAGSPAHSTISAQRPGYLEVHTESANASLLIITQEFYPGWSATIDDASAPIYPTDYLFQGVPVPAGSHDIVLQFHSRPLLEGATVSILSILAIGALFVFLP